MNVTIEEKVCDLFVHLSYDMSLRVTSYFSVYLLDCFSQKIY